MVLSALAYKMPNDMDNTELKQGTNTGVIVVPPDLKKVWAAGAETGVFAQILEETAQYDLYLPDEETQNKLNKAGLISFDALACVTFSGENSTEVLFNRLRTNGLMSVRGEKFLKDNGYINPTTNRVNFSDRFNAKLSGTTRSGNNLETVATSIRDDGLVPENVWPVPTGLADLPTDNDRWNAYYSEIPQSVKDLGQQFKKYFQINTQWVGLGTTTPDILKYWLKRGPLQVATLICSPWNSTEGMPPIPACGCGAGHAYTIYGFTETGWKAFDTYKSFKKLLAFDYCIPWAVQYYVKEVAEAERPDEVSYVFTKQLKLGAPASFEVTMLQKALQFLKDKNGKSYMKVGVYGPFGPQTKDALGRFQTDNKIKDPEGQGTNFGPKTRAIINQLIK